MKKVKNILTLCLVLIFNVLVIPGCCLAEVELSLNSGAEIVKVCRKV